jgi:hypothetical protein
LTLIVAAETDLVVFLCRPSGVVGPERNYAADAASTAGLHVRRAWPVAALALQLALLLQPAHERVGECLVDGGVTAETDF